MTPEVGNWWKSIQALTSTNLYECAKFRPTLFLCTEKILENKDQLLKKTIWLSCFLKCIPSVVKVLQQITNEGSLTVEVSICLCLECCKTLLVSFQLLTWRKMNRITRQYRIKSCLYRHTVSFRISNL